MSDFQTTQQFGVDEVELAAVYADGLWRAAANQNAATSLRDEYKAIVDEVLNPHPELEEFLRLSSISQARREELLNQVFSGRVSDLLLEFLRTLNRHGRLSIVRAVGALIEDLWKSSQGLVSVLVRSAVPLPSDQSAAVEKVLRERFRINPDVSYEVEPSILGGLWVRIGDTVYDRTVRSNLQQLRENIRARYSHEIQSGRDIVDTSAGN